MSIPYHPLTQTYKICASYSMASVARSIISTFHPKRYEIGFGVLDNPLVLRHLRCWRRRGWYVAAALAAAWLFQFFLADAIMHALPPALRSSILSGTALRGSMFVLLVLSAFIPLIVTTTYLLPAINSRQIDELMLTNMSAGEIVHGLWMTLWMRSVGWLFVLLCLYWLLVVSSFPAYHPSGKLHGGVLALTIIVTVTQPYTCSILLLSAMRHRRRHIVWLDGSFQLFIIQPIAFMSLIGVFVIALIVLAIPIMTLLLLLMELLSHQLRDTIRSFIIGPLLPAFTLIYTLALLHILTCYKLDESRVYCVPHEWLIEPESPASSGIIHRSFIVDPLSGLFEMQHLHPTDSTVGKQPSDPPASPEQPPSAR